MNSNNKPTEENSREIALRELPSELEVLHKIAQVFRPEGVIREIVGPVLEILVRETHLERAALALHDPNMGEISIEESYGMSESEQTRGKYRVGEGVTGQVVQSGQPMVIPRVSEAPEFLNRTRARKIGAEQDYSFFCVPLRVDHDTFGALSAECRYEPKRDLSVDLRLLQVVAVLIAQAVHSEHAAALSARLARDATSTGISGAKMLQAANIIGKSKVMKDVFDLIAQVAPSSSTVLILGESGTGKELVAQAIHNNSDRAGQPFIKVNCGAIPETMVESELFGHEKGAFTGAIAQRKGRFELADRGTIFLDEVGELSTMTQVKLLRVLQEREFERVGGSKTVKTDVRVIAATSRNLEELMASGSFRLDLYYRLNVFPIHTPPLRERTADVILLADHFVSKYNKLHNKNVRRIATSALDMLTAYHWPGNVRELENCIERAVLLSGDDVIHGHHLPPSLQTAEATGTVFRGTLQDRLDNLEKELILDALKSTRGNMTRAAEQLGITERIMGLRVRRFEINPTRFRVRSES